MQLNDIFTSKAVERTFEDLFSTRFYVKAYNKFYNSNNDVFDFKESFEPLDETLKFDSPIVNAVQVHLKEFCDSSLNKVAVVRNYFELVDTEKGKKVMNANIDKLSSLIESTAKKLIS